MINKEIKTLIENLYPQAKIKLISEGDHSKAYKINNDYVLKVAKNDEGSKGLVKECKILKAIKGKTTVAVPKVVKTGSITIKNKECGYSICSLVEGKKLSPEQFKKLSKPQREQIAKDIALFLTELHAIETNIPYKINRLQELDEQLEFIKQHYFERFDKRKKNQIIKFYEKEKEFTKQTTNRICLIHNDFSSSNILFDDNNFAGVIDFGDAGIGDEDNDFLCLLENSNEEFGRNFGKLVLKYYEHENPDLAIEKEKHKNAIWKYEELYYGTLYNDKEMIEEALQNI